jgi:hypothetical protein
METRFGQIKERCGLIGNYICDRIYTDNGITIKAKTYDIKNTIYTKEDIIDDTVVVIDIDCGKLDYPFKDVKKIILDDIIGLSFSINQGAVEARYDYLLTINKSSLVDIEIPILKDRVMHYIHLNNITDTMSTEFLKTVLRRYSNRFKYSKVEDCPNLSPLLTAISWFIIRPFRKSDV